jgi:hypothetical protein
MILLIHNYQYKARAMLKAVDLAEQWTKR